MFITTNIKDLHRAFPTGIRVSDRSAAVERSRIRRLWGLCLDALRADYVIVHFELNEVLMLGTLLWLWPFGRGRLITLDLFVPALRKQMHPVIRFAFRRVHTMLVHFRQFRYYEETFYTRPGQFRFVPFKINAFGAIESARIRDEGFVFCGGRSRRDFKLLFEVLQELGYPAKVMIGNPDLLEPNGSSLKGLQPPPNVTLITDERPELFVDTMAAARVVALPIVPGSVTQAGIGVYLMAMALAKCVVISEGLGIDDVLSPNEALIVPQGDRRAFRDALKLAWEDNELRAAYARRACEYARPHGEEEALRQSIVSAVLDIEGSQGSEDVSVVSQC